MPAEAREASRSTREAPPRRSKPGTLRPEPLPRPVRVERDQDRRAHVALGHARGADADDPGVPALAPEDDRGAGLALGLELGEEAVRVGQDLALGLAAVVVGAVELDGDLAGPLGIVGEEELDGRVGAVEAPRGVDPRREAEADVGLVHALGRDLRTRP